MDADGALWGDRILVCELAESVRAGNLNELFLLQHHQRAVDDVVERQAHLIGDGLSSDLVVVVDEFQGQIRDRRQIQAGLFDRLRFTGDCRCFRGGSALQESSSCH